MKFDALKNELTSFYFNELDELSKSFKEKATNKLDQFYNENLSSFQMKELQYKVISEEIEPKIFSNSPFYYEVGTMAAICDGACEFRGHFHAGGWTYWKNKHLYKDQDEKLFNKFTAQRSEILYLICGTYCDEMQHFPFYHRPIFEMGLKGVYEKTLLRLENAQDDEKEFLNSVISGLLAIKRVAEKFSEKADELLINPNIEKEERDNLLMISESAKYSPWNAPRNFYEALNVLAFMRKVVGALEGIGVNSFGRLDMDLYPFYKNDVEKGILNKEKAYELICKFLLTWDCHYDHDMKMVGYSDHELENTYVLGGCDENGDNVFNELTEMFLKATSEYKIIYPKIKCRISKSSPKEYLDLINYDVMNGTSTVLYSNDDSVIPALVKAGHTLKEARDYIETGCWGLMTNGLEKIDGGNYVNILKIFEYSIHNRVDKMEKVGINVLPIDDAKSFEEVYSITLSNFKKLLLDRADVLNKGKAIRSKVNPLPIFSSTLYNCIEKAKDYTQGGAKYNDDNVLFIGFPNIVDSLLSIKRLCFDKCKYTLKQLLTAVRNNWVGYEGVLNDTIKCNGWGDESEESNSLAKRLNLDLYNIVKDIKTLYGGKTKMGHLTYTEIKWWGAATLATPDGRKNGEYFSQGLTPSRLKHLSSTTSVLNSFSAMDSDTWGANTVVNIILPSNKLNLDIMESFIRSVTECGVQSLQLNCTTKEQLLDAQKHPENYKNLIIRVCGFSARFTALSPEWQDEILTRNFYD